MKHHTKILALIVAVALAVFAVREYGSDAADGFMDGFNGKPPRITSGAEQQKHWRTQTSWREQQSWAGETPFSVRKAGHISCAAGFEAFRTNIDVKYMESKIIQPSEQELQIDPEAQPKMADWWSEEKALLAFGCFSKSIEEPRLEFGAKLGSYQKDGETIQQIRAETTKNDMSSKEPLEVKTIGDQWPETCPTGTQAFDVEVKSKYAKYDNVELLGAPLFETLDTGRIVGCKSPYIAIKQVKVAQAKASD